MRLRLLKITVLPLAVGLFHLGPGRKGSGKSTSECVFYELYLPGHFEFNRKGQFNCLNALLSSFQTQFTKRW